MPLLYPEASTFTSIFWNSTEDRSIPGAIPTALLKDKSILDTLGLASLQDHMRTRITNSSLQSSTDARYIFYAFDMLANLGMRGCNSWIILSQGFSKNQNAGAIKQRSEDEQRLPLFDSESIDSRPVVHKLAAALGDKMASIFYTHTCNMKDHFGMKLMKQWLDDERSVNLVIKQLHLNQHFSKNKRDELKHNLLSSSCSLALHCWMNVSAI